MMSGEGILSFSSPSCPSVSIIIPTHNEGGNLRRTVHNLLATMPPNGEIIVVDDSSTDASTDFLGGGYGAVRVLRPDRRLGVAGARNYGAEAATAEILVFSDAHVEAPLEWPEPLFRPLRSPDVGMVGPAVCGFGQDALKGYGLTWSGPSLDVQWLSSEDPLPHDVPLLCGCFTAIRRDVFKDLGGFDQGMPTWGSEDVEICIRLWVLGYRCMVVPEVAVAHLFRERFPYEVDWVTVLHNLLRVAAIHFSEEPMTRFVDSVKHHAAFPAALARLIDGDGLTRRTALRQRRRFTDAWFFDRFGISLKTP
jgi:GT2 family glycosyltransferase